MNIGLSVSLRDVEGEIDGDDRLHKRSHWYGGSITKCSRSQHILLTCGVFKNI